MRTEIKEILTDINAAMRIQHPESILIALDKILDLPEVTGNQVLENISISNIVLPIGNKLSEKNISEEIYGILTEAEFAVFRAIAAVIAARKFVENEDINVIEVFALDRRRDVRSALTIAISEISTQIPIRIVGLIKKWVLSSQEFLIITAIKLMPSGIEFGADQLFELIDKLSNTDDPELKSAIFETLVNIANQGIGNHVIELLDGWEFEAGEKDWIALKTLSASWAIQYEDKAMNIIERIASSNVDERKIIKTIAALERNGAENIEAYLNNWKNSSNNKLHNIVEAYSTYEDKD